MVSGKEASVESGCSLEEFSPEIIEEELTIGWTVAGPEYQNLTKERAKELLEFLYSRGGAPDRIRVVREK